MTDLEPLDPDSPEGRRVAEELGNVLALAQERIDREDAAAARERKTA